MRVFPEARSRGGSDKRVNMSSSLRVKIVSLLKRHGYVFALIAIQSAVFYRWLFVNSIFTFGDIGVYPLEAQKNLVDQALSIYNANFGLGDMNVTASSNPFLLFYGALAYVGINSIWSQKIALFYPIVFGSVLSSYVLVKHLTRSKRAGFVGALVYSYSIPFLITLTGGLYLALAHAFAPLVFLAFIRVMDHPTLQRRAGFALIATLFGFVEFRIFYIVCWMIAIYLILSLYISRASWTEVVRHIKSFILPGTIIILMNLFWVVPILFSGMLTSNEFFDRGLFGEQYFDLLNSFAIFHPWWTWTVPSIFQKQTAAAALYIFPLLALTPLFLRFRDKRIYIFYVFLLLGFFFTKQSALPFGSIYKALYDNFPGFNAFREPSKFYFMSALSISVLLGFLVAWLQDTISFSKWRKYLAVAGFSVVVSVIFLNAETLMSGKVGTMFIPREFPQEYRELNRFIDSQEDNYRNFWFPHINRFGLYTDQHSAISLLTNIDTVYKKFSDEGRRKFDEYLYSPFTDERFRNILERQSVRYVIVPSNLVWDEVDSPWRDPENYKDKLNQLSFLKKISAPSLEEKDIFIYENQDVRPRIYVTERHETTKDEVPYREVNFDSNSTTRYSVRVDNIKQPLYLNFSEKYHPDWKLFFGSPDWFDVLTGRRQPIEESYHLKNDAQLNTFVMDPEYIEKNMPPEGYRKNKDGGFDIEVTLYFKPQIHFLMGVMVSGTTFLGVLAFIIYSLVVAKKKYNSNVESAYVK